MRLAAHGHKTHTLHTIIFEVGDDMLKAPGSKRSLHYKVHNYLQANIGYFLGDISVDISNRSV